MWNLLWIGAVSESESAFERRQRDRLAFERAFASYDDLRSRPSAARQAILALVRGVQACFRSADSCAPLQKEQAYAPPALWLDAMTIMTASILSGAAASEDALQFPLIVGNGILVAMIFGGILRIGALNAPFQLSSATERMRTAAGAWCAAFATAELLTALMASHSSLYGEERLFFALGGVAAVLSRAGLPVLMRRMLLRHSLSGRNHIVIWPAGDRDAERVVSELEQVAGEPVRKISYENVAVAANWSDILDDLGARVRSMSCVLGAGDIFVVAGSAEPGRLSDILANLSAIPRTVFMVPDGVTLGYLRQRCTAMGAVPALEVRRVRRDLVQLCVKRMVDVALSLVGLLLLSPLILVIAAAIRLETRGPVFFRQARTGYCGRVFRIFKFRTMRVLENGPKLAQAKRNDPRVTRVGSFLRRSSLDELPQLINVLVGDMSLVGPRPHALAHDQFYDQQISGYTLRQHVLPGITGWAQIHGLRGETSTVDAMRRRVEHDLWYAANGRLCLDIWIMIRTCVEIFRCRNAY